MTSLALVPTQTKPNREAILRRAAEATMELERRRRWRREPEAWFEERLGIALWQKQREIVRSVRDHRKTHVRSGHKVGKTLVAAGLILWFLDCYRPSRVITTSPTYTDLKHKLWGSVRGLYRAHGAWFGAKVNDLDLKITDDHYALGLSPKQVEPFQGHNAEHVLVVFDEASSIDQKFFDAADAMASRMLAIGNPLLTSGPFYKYAKSSEWNHIHISCEHHPNIVEGRLVIPGGPTAEWIESRKRHWGDKSPLYLSRVAGEFPEESSDTLFPLSRIRAAFALWEEVKDLAAAQEMNMLGLDIARAGGDKTIGYLADWCEWLENLVRRARIALSLNKTEHHATRMRVASLADRHGIGRINADAGGEGSGLADELLAMNYDVRRVMFGANPFDSDYFNVRAEMYWQLARVMRQNFALEPDDETEEELAVIGGMAGLKERSVDGVKRVVFWLPPKEEITAKLGRSPDKADALALAVYDSGRPPGDLGLSL